MNLATTTSRKPPKVSVVTVFHNRGSLVAASIGSLLDQTLNDIEIIAVDDGSTDDTLNALQAIDDSRLTVLTSSNQGFTKAIAWAVEQARASIIAVHGAGDTSLPMRLERQLAYLDLHPAVGVVGCSWRSREHKTASRLEVERGPMLAKMLAQNPFTHGEVMFRKSLYDLVGGYREAFQYAQDRDLWLRMGPHCEYAILPDVLYERLYLPDGVSRNHEQFYLQRKLSQFAVFNARQVQSSGNDLLDRYGPSALFLTPRTSKEAKKFLREAFRSFRRHSFDSSVFLVHVARTEHANALTIFGGQAVLIMTAIQRWRL